MFKKVQGHTNRNNVVYKTKQEKCSIVILGFVTMDEILLQRWMKKFVCSIWQNVGDIKINYTFSVDTDS